jgi:hypothetical protein
MESKYRLNTTTPLISAYADASIIHLDISIKHIGRALPDSGTKIAYRESVRYARHHAIHIRELNSMV